MKRHAALPAVLALLALPLAAARPTDDALSLVPPDSASAGLIRVADLRSSPLFDRVFQETGRMASDADAARFLSETGLDPKQDVDLVVFAGSPGGGGSGQALVAFEGRFDAAKLAAAMAARGAERKSTPGGDYFLLPDRHPSGHAHGNGAVAFPSNRLVVAGSETSVVAALSLRSAGGGGFPSGQGLGSQLGRLDPKASAWALVDVTRLPARAREAPAGGENPAGAVVAAMKSVSLVALSAGVEGDALRLSATGVSPDAATRQDLEDAVRGVLAAWRLAVQEKQPDLVPVLRAFKVTQGSDSVTLSGTLPGAVVRELSSRRGHAAR